MNDIPNPPWPAGGFDDGLEYVFEGVVKNSIVDHVVPHYDSETIRPRYQLNPEKRSEYNTLYENQLRDIIEGYEVYEGEETPISFESTVSSRTKSRPQNKNMVASAPTVVQRVGGLFATGSEQAKYSNWKAKQQVLKGGINHQHPHCDNAIVNTYANLDVFPFVCIHGFGMNEFNVWLLPNPFHRHYGFMHTFAAKNMLIMRGDFVHAGGPGCSPRAHLEFSHGNLPGGPANGVSGILKTLKFIPRSCGKSQRFPLHIQWRASQTKTET